MSLASGTASLSSSAMEGRCLEMVPRAARKGIATLPPTHSTSTLPKSASMRPAAFLRHCPPTTSTKGLGVGLSPQKTARELSSSPTFGPATLILCNRRSRSAPSVTQRRSSTTTTSEHRASAAPASRESSAARRAAARAAAASRRPRGPQS